MQKYYEKTNDVNALAMKNYVRFGTNDEKEIWLIRYGFTFEEIEWIKAYVLKVDENSIEFDESIGQLSDDKKAIISRYI